ncbi:pantothenate kinase [Thermococcus chitonophagus]|uniref:Pantoate kinase n=1 Tax=Thermococcus chitonophagus TaxID=54262 RepID=A0A161KB16_9EURY|nr:pantoate kinase [Thermococcus chitonophagus]ASJ16141.1 pantothenate kinase [Thermococcus chitonophagus]CUX78890.1 Pantoate kinase, archaeal [Thermococcus chitonophagus]
MLIRAFVPAHITAFFVPVIKENPQLSGSLGAGINLNKGTNVFLNTEEASLERHIHVAFNGEPVKREQAKITYYVTEKMLPEDFVGEVEIWQYFDFPNGYGFGNSAGGALGTALTLAYKFGKTLLEAAKIAHEAEVIHGGGLGDVVAQLTGGIDIRIREGGPGVAVVDNILRDEYKVLVVPLGRLKTRDVLSSDIVHVISREGKKSLDTLLKNPTPETLMNEARRFAEATNLMDEELKEISREIDKVISLQSSMIMLGKGLFALIKEGEVDKVKELLLDLNLRFDILDIYWGKPIVGRWIGDE